jgi:putative Holliday junction resolvase
LGIDLGEVRVGLAVSDDLGMLAHPWETIPAGADLAGRVARKAAERGVEVIVVGVPRNMDGTYGPAAEKSRAFLAQLAEVTAARVVGWDERLTTVAAQRALREAGRPARKQRDVVDQAAAQILLQSWLDAQA